MSCFKTVWFPNRASATDDGNICLYGAVCYQCCSWGLQSIKLFQWGSFWWSSTPHEARCSQELQTRVINGSFTFRLFLNDCTNSCHLSNKIYNPDILWPVFGQVHGGGEAGGKNTIILWTDVLSPAAGWRSGVSVMEPITACKSLELLYDVCLGLCVMFSPLKLKMQMSDCSFLSNL